MTEAINSAGRAALVVTVFLALILMFQRFDGDLSTKRFWIVAPLLAVFWVVGVALWKYAP